MRHATGIITEKLHVARLYCNALFNLNETPIMINYTENYILRAARLTGKSNDSHLQQSSLLQRAMSAMTSNKNCSKSMNTHHCENTTQHFHNGLTRQGNRQFALV